MQTGQGLFYTPESSGECLRGSATQEGWIDTNFGRQFGQQSTEACLAM